MSEYNDLMNSMRKALDKGDYLTAEHIWPFLKRRGLDIRKKEGEFPDDILDLGIEMYEGIIDAYGQKIGDLEKSSDVWKALNARTVYTGLYERLVLLKVSKMHRARECSDNPNGE